MSKDESEKYVDDLKKWQNNQYSPGEYLGGNFPLDVKYGGKKVGYVLLMQSLVIIVCGIALLVWTNQLGVSIFFLVVGLIVSYAGWRRIRKAKKK